jgi:recombinational DNA repair protein (RecF pathway)
MAKPAPMAPATVTDIERFERVLLLRGVGVLTADRNRCADCGRTPLVGERVHLYEHRGGIVCELCRSLCHDAPVATETVRHSERGHCVRLAARAA